MLVFLFLKGYTLILDLIMKIISLNNTQKSFLVPFFLLLVIIFGIYNNFTLYYYVFMFWLSINLFFSVNSRVSTVVGLILLALCAIALTFKNESLSELLAGLSFIFLVFSTAGVFFYISTKNSGRG